MYYLYVIFHGGNTLLRFYVDAAVAQEIRKEEDSASRNAPSSLHTLAIGNKIVLSCVCVSLVLYVFSPVAYGLREFFLQERRADTCMGPP